MLPNAVLGGALALGSSQAGCEGGKLFDQATEQYTIHMNVSPEVRDLVRIDYWKPDPFDTYSDARYAWTETATLEAGGTIDIYGNTTDGATVELEGVDTEEDEIHIALMDEDGGRGLTPHLNPEDGDQLFCYSEPLQAHASVSDYCEVLHADEDYWTDPSTDR